MSPVLAIVLLINFPLPLFTANAASPIMDCKWTGSNSTHKDAGRPRAFVAIMGLLNRSQGCTYSSQQLNIVHILRKVGFDVDTYAFHMVTEAVASHVQPQSPNMSWLPPEQTYTFYEEQLQARLPVDTKLIPWCQPGSYSQQDRVNVLRQFYIENQAGAFLHNALKLQAACEQRRGGCDQQICDKRGACVSADGGQYDVAVALMADILVPRPISLVDAYHLVGPKRSAWKSSRASASAVAPPCPLHPALNKVVLTTRNNDGRGFTNGLYMGHPEAVADLLMRARYLHRFHKLKHKNHDFEWFVFVGIQMSGLQHGTMRGFCASGSSFVKVRDPGSRKGLIFGEPNVTELCAFRATHGNVSVCARVAAALGLDACGASKSRAQDLAVPETEWCKSCPGLAQCGRAPLFLGHPTAFLQSEWPKVQPKQKRPKGKKKK